jgi:hypothetical protein
MLAKDWGKKKIIRDGPPDRPEIWDYVKTEPADAVKVLKETLLNDDFASDGTGYRISFPNWPFKEIQFVASDDVNVCTRTVCRPRSSPLKAVSQIRSVHFTGAFELGSVIKSDYLQDGPQGQNQAMVNRLLGAKATDFPTDAQGRFDDCKGIFSWLMARQLTLLFRVAKRTKLELWFWNMAVDAGEEGRSYPKPTPAPTEPPAAE